MDAIYLLVPIAIILVIVGLTAFFWAVKNDQFDDLEGPAHSILFDDDPKAAASKKASTAEQQSTRKATNNANQDH